MRKRGSGQSRKLLIASIGVASMTYVATTSLVTSCGGSTAASSQKDSGKGSDAAGGADAIDDFPVANLAVMPDAPNDSLQIDDFPVANLAVMPDSGMPDVVGG